MNGRKKCLRMKLPFQGLPKEALLPAPVDADRFVIRATHERGVGVPSSRSLATATREASLSVVGQPRTGISASLLGSMRILACASGSPSAVNALSTPPSPTVP